MPSSPLAAADLAAIRRGVRPLANGFEVEDLIQESAVAILSRRADLPTERGKRDAYLYRAGRNAALDAHRRRTIETVPVSFEPVTHCTPERAVLAAERLAEVRSVLTRVARRWAVPIWLAWAYGSSSAEAAAVVGSSASAFDSAVCRLRPKLAAAGVPLAARGACRG